MVVVRIWGKTSAEERMLVRNDIAAACANFRFKRLLVDFSDVDMQGVATAEGRNEFGKHAAEDEIYKGVAIATVLPKDFASCLDIKFIGAVAENAGKEIGEFTTFAEAREWLMS